MARTQHAPSFVCPQHGCNTTCSGNSELKRHLKEVHVSDIKYCPEEGCTHRGTIRPSKLQTHMQDKHPDLFNVPLEVPEGFAFDNSTASVFGNEVHDQQHLEQALYHEPGFTTPRANNSVQMVFGVGQAMEGQPILDEYLGNPFGVSISTPFLSHIMSQSTQQPPFVNCQQQYTQNYTSKIQITNPELHPPMVLSPEEFAENMDRLFEVNTEPAGNGSEFAVDGYVEGYNGASGQEDRTVEYGGADYTW